MKNIEKKKEHAAPQTIIQKITHGFDESPKETAIILQIEQKADKY